MMKQRLCGLVFSLAAVLVFGLNLQAQTAPGKKGEPKVKGKEGTGYGKRAQAFIAAFNKGDAKALAAFWTPQGGYIDQLGGEFRGRAALEKLYKEVFEGSPAPEFSSELIDVHALGSPERGHGLGVALVKGRDERLG